MLPLLFGVLIFTPDKGVVRFFPSTTTTLHKIPFFGELEAVLLFLLISSVLKLALGCAN